MRVRDGAERPEQPRYHLLAPMRHVKWWYFRWSYIMRKRKPVHIKTSKQATRSRLCIYCGRTGTTRDHVPPRLLLHKPFPDNLLSVPACLECNNSFSEDEEYFRTVLAHIATVASLAQHLDEGGDVDRAFARTPAKEQEILKILAPDETGRIRINPDLHRIERVIRKIARGLYFIRYGQRISDDDVKSVAAHPYNIEDQRPAHVFINTYTERFQPKRWSHLQPNIFSFIFTRPGFSDGGFYCIMDFHRTLWGVASFPPPVSPKRRASRQPLGQFKLEFYPEKAGGCISREG